MADRKLFILKIDSYEGEGSARQQRYGEVDEGCYDSQNDALYAIVSVEGDKAEIIDDGYGSYEEAKKTWPEAL